MTGCNSVTILIVGDCDLDTDHISRLIRPRRTAISLPTCTIQTASTGSAGLKVIQSITPDCVLLDYALPDMSGLDFLDYLSELLGDSLTSIVMLIEHEEGSIAADAMKRGVHDFLIKGDISAGFLSWSLSSALEKAELYKQVQNQHEELELFADRITHDILGPLSNLSLYAEHLGQLEQEGVTSDDQDFTVNTVVQSLDHIMAQVEAFRTYTRIGRSRSLFSEVDLGEIVDHIRLLLSNNAEQTHVQIDKDQLPTVLGNSEGLGQLFQNLIANSIKYCTRKPSIRISAKWMDIQWLVSVSDNGIGMPKSAQCDIFEPFVRLHSRTQYPGAGMGLATCKKVVQQHGGKIWFTSEPGKGTTFFFTLAHLLIDDRDSISGLRAIPSSILHKNLTSEKSKAANHG